MPEEYRGDAGMVTLRHEEDALCWLWAYPSIFPWHASVVWLYTPVVGNTRWPGDLWGIDRDGELLIIECKQCRRAANPFQDFLVFHKDGRDEFKATHWQRKFLKHYRAELAFPDITSERPPNRTDGILPRSNRRSHIRRWSALAKEIDSRIRSADYQDAALSSLDRRADRGDPQPYYIALMAISDGCRSILSASAKASRANLAQAVGEDHVLVISIQADRVPPNKARISTRLI